MGRYGAIDYSFRIVSASDRLCLFPTDAEGLWCCPPAEDTALCAVAETGRHLQTAMSRDSIEALLVAVLPSLRSERFTDPSARLNGAVGAHHPIALLPVTCAEFLGDAHNARNRRGGLYLSRNTLETMKSRARTFRKLLDGDKLFVRPCAYDALSAVLIEQAGFRVMGTTGYGITASLVGQPDIGLVGYAEMLERSRTIINAVKLPVDVDVDTGYGNAINVYWTVQNFARVGAAGVRVEDQEWPKRCGHMAGKSIISSNEMLGKIRAAVKARDEEDVDMVIGARTDARSILSFKETVERAAAYADSGADYVYVEAPQSLEEVEELVKRVSVPLAFNIIPGGKTPPFKIEDLEARGVRYLSVPMICIYPAVKAMQEALSELKTSHDLNRITEMGVSWATFNEIVGNTAWSRLELETLSTSELKAKYSTSDLAEIKRRATEVRK